MGGGTAGNHSDKITRCNGIGRGTTKTLSGIFTFNTRLWKGETAGTHGTVFTASPLSTNVTSFHGDRPVKNRFNTQFLGSGNHFLGGYINRGRYRIRHLLWLLDLFFFHFCHLSLLLLWSYF
jgi:hypothetical protein